MKEKTTIHHLSLAETLSNIDHVASLNNAHPDLLCELAKMACLGFDKTLNLVIPLIQYVTPDGLLRMHPDTLYHVASMVSEQLTSRIPLDMLSGILNHLSSHDLACMHPLTLQAISTAATLGSPSALNALSLHCLPNLTLPQFESMGGIRMLNLISNAGQLGCTHAIDALTHIIEHVKCHDIIDNPVLLCRLAMIACKGHDAPLKALSDALRIQNGFTVRSLCCLSGNSLSAVADAVSAGHASTLNNMASILKNLSLGQFSRMDSSTIKCLSQAACNQHPDALNSVAPLFAFMTFQDISELSSGTFMAVVAAADHGYTSGLVNLGHAFCKTTPEEQDYLDPRRRFFEAYDLLCQSNTPPLSRHSSFSRFSSPYASPVTNTRKHAP